MKTANQIWQELEKGSKREKLSKKFEFLWQELGGPELEKEHKFHPVRRWRFDYSVKTKSLGENRYIFYWVAIEIEGGVWMAKGGHNTGVAINEDCIKYNAATLLGWKVFRLTGDMITSEHLCPIIKICQ